jgi:hypothetical protein
MAHPLVAWQSRWRLLNEETHLESRHLSPADRLSTLNRLRAFAVSRRLIPRFDELEVWERFERLRQVSRARAGR